MLTEKTMEKLRILAESAKYDVSCSSSGTVRKGKQGMVGSTVGGVGICHSFADDGRCISLLKVMLTNYCMYDCAYCINRRSNDIKRATLSVSELEEITMEFYRRNYIEGLFLSSGVVRNPDYTMERLAAIARDLRTVHRFNGYIHLKSIPGCSQELLNEAGRYADRMSVNIEIPREESLRLLAPEKDHQSVFQPMALIQQGVLENKEDRRRMRHAPRFVPAGQSTQMIVGATQDTDRDILRMSSALYAQPTMRRVYYSGYISVNTYESRLPVLRQPPLVRENRLYQADWLLRFYKFSADELVDDQHANLDLDVDPKLAWALRHPEAFPVDINTADYERMLQIQRERLANAADYTFTFVGNFDETLIRQYIEQYIASLPASKKLTQKKSVNHVWNGHVENRFKAKMQDGQSIVVEAWRSNGVPYTVENRTLLQAAADVLEAVYLKSIREEHSASYTVAAQSDVDTDADQYYYTLMGYCPCDPAKAELAESLLKQGMQDAASNIDPEMLAKVKEAMLNHFDDDAKNNSHWLNYIYRYNRFGTDFYNGYKELVSSITPAKVSAFIRDVILKSGHHAEVVMMPEESK